MSKIILGILVGLILGAAGAATLVKYPQVADLLRLSQAEEEPAAEAPAEVSFLQRDANGVTTVQLDSQTQTRMGLMVAPLAAAQAPAEMEGFGHVLDPGPLAALVSEDAAAQTALQASTREYERVKTLFSQDQNASARALETAEAAMNKDRIALDAVRLRLLTGWGPQIASRPDLPLFVASLATQQAALVRVDLPLGETPQAPPTDARVTSVGAREDLRQAQVLGLAPSADPQTQAAGYLLFVRTDGGKEEGKKAGTEESGSALSPSSLASPVLVPGTALTAWLAIPAAPRPGVIVPRDAVLRHEGGTFVYLQTRADAFQRKPVALEQPTGDGWFVSRDLKPQDKVVVVGAQQLLSEELKGQGGEE